MLHRLIIIGRFFLVKFINRWEVFYAQCDYAQCDYNSSTMIAIYTPEIRYRRDTPLWMGASRSHETAWSPVWTEFRLDIDRNIYGLVTF